MTSDQAMTLAVRFIETAVLVTSPVFAAAVGVGVSVGILQTATQIQEPSIVFVAKVTALIAITVLVGPVMAEKLISYTRTSFESISQVTQ